MKKRLFPVLLFACVTGLAAGAEFVHETDSLLTASADVDGDGDADAVIVDRVTGVVTIGIRQADGSLAFRAPLASGIPGVTGMAVGRLQKNTRDTLALTSPLANRVQVMSAVAEDMLPYQTEYPVAGTRFIAPNGGGGAEENLLLAAQFDGEQTVRLRVMTNGGGGEFTTAGNSTMQGGQLQGWNPVRLARAGETRLAYVENGFTASLRVAVLNGNEFAEPVTATGLPAGCRMLYGHFDSEQSDFLFYQPGKAGIEVLRVLPTEKDFTASGFDAGREIAQMLRLPGEETDQVMMIFADGTAAVYDYTQAGGFTLADSLDLSGEPGAAQSAVALADGSFALLTGLDADGRPTAHRLFSKNGDGRYVPHSGGSLPKLGGGQAAFGNVFFFSATPFLNENARLVGQWSVGDWSSAMIFGATPRADGESFVSSILGLGSRFTREFTPVPSGAVAGLANQYRDDISLARLNASPRVLGDLSAGVTVQPAGGLFKEAVQVSLVAAGQVQGIYYRRSASGTFTLYSNPFYLYQNSVVEAYALMADGKRTPVTQATFSFSQAPEKQDTDGDGVPDFVELELELDPDGGADTDGDGFSDLDELLAGTSPSLKGQFPEGDESRPETTDKVNLAIQPRPWDGPANSEVFARIGLPVECHEVDGALLGEGRVSKPADEPFAAFPCQPVEAQQRLLVVSTPLHYQLRSDEGEQRRGRELVGLVAVPDAVPVEIPFEYGVGSQADRTASWIQAAQAAYAAVGPAVLIKSIGVDETLAFLLLEARVGELLQFRGIGGSTDFSLTPFREHEGRDPFQPGTVSSAQLLSLEQGVGDPQFSDAVKLRELLAHYESVVRNTKNDPTIELLKQLAREIYQISSMQHDEVPGGLKPPLDALRQFIRFISLDAEYVSRISLKQEELFELYQLIYPLRHEAPVRPYVRLTLKIPENAPADGQTYAESLSGALTYVLRDKRGQPFEMPGHFRQIPGSQFSIIAYDDLPPETGGHPLEVFSLTLTTIPLASVTDTDGNLLSDEWELLYFGSTGQDAFSSPDGSGYSLLQQFLAGTDPTDASSVPTGAPGTFSFGGVAQRREGDGSFVIDFQWSSSFGDAFEFVVQETTDMVGFSPRAATFHHLGGDQYQAVVPATGAGRVFYRVGVRLP
ncbi:hypothetical protein WJU23_15560 [Prosthecobacter sp. SYSU 5D2]|uniref:hypothetical protein n=1 Tax=Prosthecobacter sp. SYSU 5D2 TaxID=3134134 RepID=UPI0031FEAB7E